MSDHWMNPLEKIRFQKAVSQRRRQVLINDKIALSLDYTARSGSVWFQNTRDPVPCGYMNIVEVCKEEFVTT
jgi:hypothetical protein